MPARRFPLVDAMRALAALAVVGTHTAYFAGAYAPGTFLGPYAQRLDVGVTLFFVISGFLLYRPWVLARHEGRRSPDTGLYAWRRVLRIVPAYWVALTAALVLVTAAGGWSWDRTPALFGFAQAYRADTLGYGLVQGWSLCVELAFYVFLPVWGAGMRRVRGGLGAEWLGLALLAAVAIAWKVVVTATTGSPQRVEIGPWLFALPTFLDQFAVGMGLAVATVHLGNRPTPAWLDRGAGASWLLAGVAFWVTSTQIGISELFGAWTPLQYLGRHLLYLVIAALLLWPAVLGHGGPLRRALALRPLEWIGVVSYGIFLWNTTVLDQLAQASFEPFLGIHPYVAWPLAVVPITLALAAASWYGIERPLQRLGRRRPRRRLSPARAAAG